MKKIRKMIAGLLAIALVLTSANLPQISIKAKAAGGGYTTYRTA